MNKPPIIKLNLDILQRLEEKRNKLPKVDGLEIPTIANSIVLFYENIFDLPEMYFNILDYEDAPLRIRWGKDNNWKDYIEARLIYDEERGDRKNIFTINDTQGKYQSDDSGIFDSMFKMVVDHYLIISECMLYPDQVFDINPVSKKHRIAPRKSWIGGGDDEELYSALMGCIAYKGTAKATGLGTPHSHEYGRRGHIRTYKNGKQVVIRPTICCKGRGTEIQHEYVVIKGE